MPPRRPTNLHISTTAKDLEIVAGVEAMENDRALVRLREECDMVFGDTHPPRDINMLTYNKVHGLTDETPCTYGEITRHVESWQRTQPCVEFCKVVARDGETFTCEAIYYQGPTSPPYIPEKRRLSLPPQLPASKRCSPPLLLQPQKLSRQNYQVIKRNSSSITVTNNEMKNRCKLKRRPP